MSWIQNENIMTLYRQHIELSHFRASIKEIFWVYFCGIFSHFLENMLWYHIRTASKRQSYWWTKTCLFFTETEQKFRIILTILIILIALTYQYNKYCTTETGWLNPHNWCALKRVFRIGLVKNSIHFHDVTDQIQLLLFNLPPIHFLTESHVLGIGEVQWAELVLLFHLARFFTNKSLRSGGSIGGNNSLRSGGLYSCFINNALKDWPAKRKRNITVSTSTKMQHTLLVYVTNVIKWFYSSYNLIPIDKLKSHTDFIIKFLHS